MDTTETYIKMCERAEEMQAGWKPKEWDLYFQKRGIEDNLYDWYKEHIWAVLPESIADSGVYGRVFVDEDNGEVEFDLPRELFVWLPDQSQLQAMVLPKMEVWDKYPQMIKLTAQFDAHSQIWNDIDNPSMEQLWLAFVMKEKYGKVWNGEDWIGYKSVSPK